MLIGICGKSGSGKSTIAKELAKDRFNFIHLDIDTIGHKSHNDEEVKQKLINTFGSEITPDGNIDRKKLGRIVFSSKEDMKKLEDITWNYMEKEIDKFINNNKDKIIILDWQLLPKTKYMELCDIKVLIDIPYEIRKQRAIKRDNITEEQFNLREKASITYNKSDFDYVFNINEETNIRKLVKKYE